MADVNTHTPDGKKVELVTADQWNDMSITQLFDQKMLLGARLSAVMQLGNPAMIKQMNIGMMQLDAVIRYKEQQRIKNIDNRNKDITGLI